MADLPGVEAQLKTLPPDLKKTFTDVFRRILRDMRFGHPQGESPDPSTNFGGGFYYGTTSSVANREFSIEHDFGRTPYLAIPVLPLDEVNAQIVPLKVTRAADANRLYLSSSVTGAPVVVYVEG